MTNDGSVEDMCTCQGDMFSDTNHVLCTEEHGHFKITYDFCVSFG